MSNVVLSRVGITRSCPIITMSVVLQENLTWKLHILGRSLDPSIIFTTSCPSILASVTDVQKILGLLDSFPGNPDGKFCPLVQARKGKFVDYSGIII